MTGQMLDLLRLHARDAFEVYVHWSTRPEKIGIDKLEYQVAHNLNTFLLAVETLELTQPQILDLSGIYLNVKWVPDFGEIWNKVTTENGFCFGSLDFPAEEYRRFNSRLKRYNTQTDYIFDQSSSINLIKPWSGVIPSLLLTAKGIPLQIKIDFKRITINPGKNSFVVEPEYTTHFGHVVNMFRHLVTAQLLTKLIWPDDILQEHEAIVRSCPYEIQSD
jgi:hypothetical protein